MATLLNSMMTRDMHLATDEVSARGLKIKHINDPKELNGILDQTVFLQGYPTYNEACLSIIELTNYYVDAGLMVAFGKDYSICSATPKFEAESKMKLGPVTYISEYMTIHKGEECIVEGYERIKALGEKTFKVFEEVTPHIGLYCLYGPDNTVHNAIHDVL